jgi:hypothetical protein
MLQLLRETIRQQAIVNNIQLLLSAMREVELLKKLDAALAEAQQARLAQVEALQAVIAINANRTPLGWSRRCGGSDG